MGIYTNFVCERASRDVPEEERCKSLMPLNFDTYEETWGSMLDFAKAQGWKIEGGPEQTTIKCWCPVHAA